MVTAGTQFVNVIQNVGFPIAAFWLMYIFATKTLKENTNAINNLAIVLAGKFK